jgi:hypothetical protein
MSLCGLEAGDTRHGLKCCCILEGARQTPILPGGEARGCPRHPKLCMAMNSRYTAKTIGRTTHLTQVKTLSAKSRPLFQPTLRNPNG